MDVRPTWTDCDEARDYDVPNVFSPWDLVSRPDNMDEVTKLYHTHTFTFLSSFTSMPISYPLMTDPVE